MYKFNFNFNVPIASEEEKEIILKISENPMARIPVVLIADTSSSMSGDKIKMLNQEIEKFFKSIKEDPRNELLKYSLEMAVLGFKFDHRKRETSPEIICNFDEIKNQTIPELVAFGHTPLGATVNEAIEMLEKRKELYKMAGVPYYQPILVIISDGDPTDSIEEAVRKSMKLSLKKKLGVYPVIIGEDGNIDNLQRFTPNKISKRIRTEDLPEIFNWLTSSIKKVSSSSISFEIDEDLRKDWNSIIG